MTIVALLGATAAISDGWLRWALPALAAIALAAAAVASERRSARSLADLWAGAAASALLLAPVLGAAALPAPLWLAACTVLFAALHRRSGWRSLGLAGVGGAVVTLLAVCNPAFIARGWAGDAVLPVGAAGASGLLLLAAARLLREQGDRWLRDAIQSAAIGCGLAAGFVAIHALATRGASPALPLVELVLYAVMLLVAGNVDLRLGAPGDSLAGVRARVLLLAGGVFATIGGLVLSPWWGSPQRLDGLPPFDGLTLGYLAPALLVGVAARRLYAAGERAFARLGLSGSGLLASLWLLQVVRRLFGGPLLAATPVGAIEAASYALLALAAPLALAALERTGEGDWRADLRRAAEGAAWIALPVSALLLIFIWNPWWGSAAAPLSTLVALITLLLAYPAAAALALAVGRRRFSPALGDAAQFAAALHGVTGITLAVRAAYRGLDLRWSSTPAGLETWSYSALWAALAVGLLLIATRWRTPALRVAGLLLVAFTVAKVLAFDTAALDGVLRAASYLAVGALLLGGAMLLRQAARRPDRVA